MTKKATIKNGGFFKAGHVIVTTVKKNGDEDSKVYEVSGRVKIEENEKGYILHFQSFSSSRISVSNRGRVSGGRSYRQQHIIVDEYEMEE